MDSERPRVSYVTLLFCEELALKVQAHMCFISSNCWDGGGLIKVFFPVTHPGWGAGSVYHRQNQGQPRKMRLFLSKLTNGNEELLNKDDYFRRFGL